MHLLLQYVGKLCGVQTKANGHIARAVIERLAENSVTVRFIDFGNTATVKRDILWSLADLVRTFV